MVHYRMLKIYVKMGVKITKIHREIIFNYNFMCRSHIQNNTLKKATTKTEAEKDVRKLMNNSLYEKMRENLVHFIKTKFLHYEEKMMKSVEKPTFKNITSYKDYTQLYYTSKK